MIVFSSTASRRAASADLRDVLAPSRNVDVQSCAPAASENGDVVSALFRRGEGDGRRADQQGKGDGARRRPGSTRAAFPLMPAASASARRDAAARPRRVPDVGALNPARGAGTSRNAFVDFRPASYKGAPAVAPALATASRRQPQHSRGALGPDEFTEIDDDDAVSFRGRARAADAEAGPSPAPLLPATKPDTSRPARSQARRPPRRAAE